MYQRRCLQIVSPFRSSRDIQKCAIRVRKYSDIRMPNRQGSDTKGEDKPVENPAPENTARPPPQDSPVQPNQPNFSKTRQQRAAQISDEVRAIKRDMPPPRMPRGRGDPQPERSQTVDPEALGLSPDDAQTPLRGVMGQNSPIDREGPAAQTPGRYRRSLDDTKSDTMPDSQLEAGGGQEGGRSISQAMRPPQEQMMADESEELLDEDGQDVNEEEAAAESAFSKSHELELLSQFDREDKTPVPFDPLIPTRDTYLKLGQGGATIAADNFEGVIEDRIKLLAEPTQDGFRWARQIGRRLHEGGLVSLKSKEERHHALRAWKIGKYRPTFAPLPEKTQQGIIDKLVRGKYADVKATGHKSEILKRAASMTLQNGTFLDRDSERFVSKVQSFMPNAQASSNKQGQKQAQKQA